MAKMATMINGQLILEEEYDENYQPTEHGKLKKYNVGSNLHLKVSFISFHF